MAREKIRFLVDDIGRKRSVVLPMKEYREVLEDRADLVVIAERKDEPSEPVEVVRERLEKRWRTTESK